MSKIDKLIKNSLQDTPNADPEINRNLAEKFAEKAYTHNSEAESEFEISVNHVERYKKPSIFKRMGAMAAALAVIVAVGGGGAAVFKNMRNIDESSQIESSAESSAEESPEAPDIQEEYVDTNNYDMSTKEGIYSKTINSFYFYDQVSAKVVEDENYKEGVCSVSDIQLDLTNGKGYAYCSRVNYENAFEDILKGEPVVGEEDNWISKGAFFGHMTSYSNGEKCVWLYDDMYMSDVYAFEEDIKHGRTGNPVNYEAMAAYNEEFNSKFVTENGVICSDEDLENMENPNPFAECSDGVNIYNSFIFANNTLAGENLWNFDKWDIVGDVEFIGRDCVEIAFKDGIDATMYIDKETGCMLYYTYYADGQLIDYLVVDEIAFNENAVPVPEIDLSQYSYPPEVSNDEPKENSHGETYGGAGDHFCIQEDENIPDLIEFGEGYVKKSEYFEKIGCETLTIDLRQAHNKLETDVLIVEINIYDVEGEEVLATVEYYGTPEQKEVFDTAKGKHCD